MDDAWVVGGLVGKGGGMFWHLRLVPTYSFTTYERCWMEGGSGPCRRAGSYTPVSGQGDVLGGAWGWPSGGLGLSLGCAAVCL